MKKAVSQKSLKNPVGIFGGLSYVTALEPVCSFNKFQNTTLSKAGQSAKYFTTSTTTSMEWLDLFQNNA